MREGLLHKLLHNNPNLSFNNTGKEAQKSQTFKCFCSPRTFVFVWMKLKGKLLVSLPDITVCSFLRYTKDLIVALTFLNPEKKGFVQNKTRNMFQIIIIIQDSNTLICLFTQPLIFVFF